MLSIEEMIKLSLMEGQVNWGLVDLWDGGGRRSGAVYHRGEHGSLEVRDILEGRKVESSYAVWLQEVTKAEL